MWGGGGAVRGLGWPERGRTLRGRRSGADVPAGSLAEPHVVGGSTGTPRGQAQRPSKAAFRTELGKAEKGLEEEPGLCHPNSSGGSRLSALVCCGSTVLISRWLAPISGVAQKCCLGLPPRQPAPPR